MSTIKTQNKTDQPARRKLLKALAIGGVAASANLLPGSWLKPVVEMGVLPAHAATSAPLTITGVTVKSYGRTVSSTGRNNTRSNGYTCGDDPSGGDCRFKISYTSSQALIQDNTYLTAKFENGSGTYFYSAPSNVHFNGYQSMANMGYSCINSTETIYAIADGLNGVPFCGNSSDQLYVSVTINSAGIVSNSKASVGFQRPECPST